MPPPNRKLMSKGGWIKNDVGGKVSEERLLNVPMHVCCNVSKSFSAVFTM